MLSALICSYSMLNKVYKPQLIFCHAPTRHESSFLKITVKAMAVKEAVLVVVMGIRCQGNGICSTTNNPPWRTRGTVGTTNNSTSTVTSP